MTPEEEKTLLKKARNIEDRLIGAAWWQERIAAKWAEKTYAEAMESPAVKALWADAISGLEEFKP